MSHLTDVFLVEWFNCFIAVTYMLILIVEILHIWKVKWENLEWRRWHLVLKTKGNILSPPEPLPVGHLTKPIGYLTGKQWVILHFTQYWSTLCSFCSCSVWLFISSLSIWNCLQLICLEIYILSWLNLFITHFRDLLNSVSRFAVIAPYGLFGILS